MRKRICSGHLISRVNQQLSSSHRLAANLNGTKPAARNNISAFPNALLISDGEDARAAVQSRPTRPVAAETEPSSPGRFFND